MNDASTHESIVVRGSVHKPSYGHKQAAAVPIVAGVSEAGDCGGKPNAGRVGVAGGAALRRECQSGFRWRRRYQGAPAKPTELQLMPVTVTPDQLDESAPARASGLIEIAIAGGYRLRFGDGVKASTLRLVLDVLERR